MLKYPLTLITLVFAIALSNVGCGGGPANSTTNANKALNTNTAANSNAPINIAPANLQPQPVTSPATPPANAAGIPANTTVVQKGATPTPGIPSPEEQKRLHKPGATPTPGIPSPAEIQRMMAMPPPNANTPTMKGGNVQMMKSTKPLGGKPRP